MQQIIKFNQEQYEKISDDLYFLGINTIVRFNTILARKSEDGSRYHYHKEYEYHSDKYTNVNYNLVTVRRQFDFFWTIENVKKLDTNKEYIMIRLQDMYYVTNQLKNAYRWFTDPSYNNLYARDKSNKLIVYQKVEPIMISGLAMDKFIRLEPIVINYENSQSQDIGIRMSLSSDSNYVDISISKFEGFLYLLTTTDMYQSAQSQINYIQRPPYGTNCYEFNNFDIDENTGHLEGGVKRQPKINTKNKSFFDKVDDL